MRFLAEEIAEMSAAEWRAFWASRGMRELGLVLWASWDPIGGALPGEYDSYAFRIASLLGSRAPRQALVDELGRICTEILGDDADLERDAYAAEKIGDWFDHAIRTRNL